MIDDWGEEQAPVGSGQHDRKPQRGDTKSCQAIIFEDRRLSPACCTRGSAKHEDNAFAVPPLWVLNLP